MDDERLAMRVADVYKVTGELILKAMYQAMENGSHQLLTQVSSHRTYTNKVNWKQFMATKDTKHFETFLTSEINSERLEEYLKGYNVGFSMKDNRDGTSTIAIDAKNIQALEASFKGVINDLTDPDKAEKVKGYLVKSPRNMNLSEKLAYYRKKVNQEISKARTKAKTPKKTIDKGEKTL